MPFQTDFFSSLLWMMSERRNIPDTLSDTTTAVSIHLLLKPSVYYSEPVGQKLGVGATACFGQYESCKAALAQLKNENRELQMSIISPLV